MAALVVTALRPTAETGIELSSFHSTPLLGTDERPAAPLLGAEGRLCPSERGEQPDDDEAQADEARENADLLSPSRSACGALLPGRPVPPLGVQQLVGGLRRHHGEAEEGDSESKDHIHAPHRSDGPRHHDRCRLPQLGSPRERAFLGHMVDVRRASSMATTRGSPGGLVRFQGLAASDGGSASGCHGGGRCGGVGGL